MGYDTYMIFVNTSLDVALERHQEEKEEYLKHSKKWLNCSI